MGNRFTNRKAVDVSLKLSNGGTHVLFDVLLIAASRLAALSGRKVLQAGLQG
jgi:hypothetical protein